MDAILKSFALCVFGTILQISDTYGYETCLLWPVEKHCYDGSYCCDDDTQCCPDPDNVLEVGAIVGIVIGCILFISCVVAVICVVAKQGHRPGRVIQPNQQGIAMVSIAQQHGQPMYGQPSSFNQPPPYGQPQQYGQPQYGQPQYGQQFYGAHPPPSGDKAGTRGPAYPPPPSNY